MIVRSAAELFRRGDIAGAYAYYQLAAQRYGERGFSYNLQQCRRLLAQPGRLSSEAIRLSPPRLSILLSAPDNLSDWPFAHLDLRTATCDVSMFCCTPDGLRPIHDKAWFDTAADRLVVPEKALRFPPCDHLLTVAPGRAFMPADIDSYLAFVQGRCSENISPFRQLEMPKLPIVAGRVSVIIPTYKRPDNLGNALESVACQDFLDKEIIVVDDNGEGSPFREETAAIVATIRKKYPQVSINFLAHARNRNGAAARNSGLLQATGEYIAFLDDDDVYLPGRLRESIAVLRDSPASCGAVYCGYLGWNSSYNDQRRYRGGDLSLEILLLDYEKHYLHTNTMTYRRAAVLALGGFDETYRRHQDLEFNLRFFSRYTTTVLEKILVQLTPRPSAVSNKSASHDLLALKFKFLTRFAPVINRFQPELISQIYLKHLGEMARNFQSGV